MINLKAAWHGNRQTYLTKFVDLILDLTNGIKTSEHELKSMEFTSLVQGVQVGVVNVTLNLEPAWNYTN